MVGWCVAPKLFGVLVSSKHRSMFDERDQLRVDGGWCVEVVTQMPHAGSSHWFVFTFHEKIVVNNFDLKKFLIGLKYS